MKTLVFLLLIGVTPDRPAPKADQKACSIPDLTGATIYGTIIQNGRELMLAGPEWNARGTIREDGTIMLLWEQKATGRVAFSVYRLRGKSVVGEWGWADSCAVENSELRGNFFREDVLRGRRDEPSLPASSP
jgi:hypothetical protein